VATVTKTPLPTVTSTPVATVTKTPLPTATSTPVATVTKTPLLTATNMPQPTATKTIAPTYTPTRTPATTPSSTATSAPVVVTFLSAGSQDGSILESTEGSQVGGTMNSSATTFLLGDDAANRQYRAILSFNTASLPDNAVIQSAAVRILQSGAPTGTDPFTIFGSLAADITKGYFGGNSGLELSDFNAAASANGVGTFGTTRTNGWYNDKLIGSGLSNINKTGLTQVRLGFTMATNANATADTIQFVTGDATTGQPQLVITYTLP
jgi:hypothetical protein